MRKRILSLLFVFACVVALASCGDKTTDNAPVITGAVDKTIAKGSKFLPLEGITASDTEDGDLTDSIEVEGSVNPNKEGEYTLTYYVYDKDGNEASVTVKITVVFTDTTKPMISGVANKEIVIGSDFNKTDGVSVTDAVDGNLTSALVVTGEVDVWTAGTYELVYSVSDAAGNTESKTRTITVGLGYFGFDENILTNEAYTDGELTATVSTGAIDTSLSSYGLALLTFKAQGEGELTFSLTDATSKGKIALTATETEYKVYFRFDSEITDGTLKVTGPAGATVTDVKLQIGAAKDVIAPVIEFAEDYKPMVPGAWTDPDKLKDIILKGVTATDNVDGDVFNSVDIDYGTLELGNLASDETVTIYVADKAGNVAEKELVVTFANTYNTHIIQDPTFDTANAETDNWKLNGGSGNPTLTFKDGTMIHQTTNDADAGWDSASSPYIRFEAGTFKAGNWYLLSFKAKAQVDRVMKVRIGLDTTEALSWIEDFEGASNATFPLTTEYKEYNILFYVHADVSEGGLETVKMELKIGTIYWGSNEKKNPVTFDDLQFYLLSNQDTAPTIEAVEGLPTTFGAGATVDFTKYVTAYDLEDGKNIEITNDMVDLSGVNMAAAGNYEVVFKVKDSANNEAVYKLPIKVLAEADTQGPTIATASGFATTVAQFSDAVNLKAAVSVTDNVDAAEEIVVTYEGSVDVKVAGTYKVVYTAKDTSGNVSTYEVTFTVTDNEAPVVTPVSRVVNDVIQVKVGSTLNLAKLVKVTDNVDGDIAVTDANITVPTGLFVDGVITSTVGDYVVLYAFKDAANKEVNYELTVRVVEEVKFAEEIVVTGIAQGGTALEFSDDMMTVTSTHGKTLNGSAWGRWDVASPAEKYTNAKVTIMPATDLTLVVKIDANGNPYDAVKGNKITKAVKAGELAVFEWDLTALNIDAKSIIKVVFYAYDPSEATTSGEFTLQEIEFFHSAKQPELPEGTVDANIKSVAQDGGNTYTFSEDKMSVSVKYGKSVAKWARWDIEKPTEAYTHAIAVFKGTDMALGAKLDADGNPYDGVKGNKVYKTLNGYVVYEWDLTALNIDATKLTKLVVWAYDPTEITTTGEFELVDFAFYTVVEEGPELPKGAVDANIVSTNQGGKTYVFSEDKMTVTSTHGTSMNQWGRWDITKPTEKYTNAMAIIKGNGMALSAKLDTTSPANNKYDGVKGNKQYKTLDGFTVFEWDLEALGMDATLLEKLVFWAYDPNGSTTGKFTLVDFVFYNKEKAPELPEGAVTPSFTGVNQGGKTYVFSEDKKTVTSTHGASMGQWGRWDFAKVTEDYTNVMAVIYGSNVTLCAKVDTTNGTNNKYDGVKGNKQYKTLDGFTVFEWDLAALNMDAKLLEKLVFWAYDPNGSTTATFELVSLVFYNASEAGDDTEKTPTNVTVTYTGVKQGGSTYVFSEDKMTVTSTHGTSMGQWGRWDYTSTEAYNKVVVKVKATSQFALCMKLDTNTPDNNKYDGVTGNKQYKTLKADEVVTFEWDLDALGMDSTLLQKVVFWAYDPNGSTTGTFQVLSIDYIAYK